MARDSDILRVKSAVVVITRQGPMGTVLNYAYQNELLFPGDGTPAERARFLKKGMVEPVTQEEVAIATAARAEAEEADVDDLAVTEPVEGSDDAGQGGDEGSDPLADSVPFDDPKRVEARGKLPAEGLPDGRAAQAVWVEAAVREGYAFNAVKGEEKAALVDLLSKKN